MHGGRARPVAGHAEEAHLAALARKGERLERPALPERGLPVGLVHQVVELDQVDHVGAEPLARAFEARAGAGGVARVRLRGEEEARAVALQPRAEAQLRVAVHGRGVE